MKVDIAVGGTWHAPHLGYQLQQRDMLDVVFTTTPKGRFRHRADVNPSRIRWLPMPEAFGPRLPSLLRISPSTYAGSLYLHAVSFDRLVSQALRHRRPDLLVAFAWFGLYSLRECKRRGIPTIVERGSAHTIVRERILEEEHELQGVPLPRKRIDPRIVERELMEYAEADYISVPSRFAEDSFVQMGTPRERMLRVPYGVDLRRFQPQAPRVRRTGALRIVTVGNLGLEKGTPYLVAAVEQIRGLPIELLLVGSVEPDMLRRLQNSLVPWQFIGAVRQDQLPDVLSQSAIYCLPSVQEGMSMTVLEAMACGMPVVASANTGAADIITDGVDGYVVPIRDVGALAARLELLVRDEGQRIEMGRRARERVASMSWDDYGARICREYDKIARAGGHSLAR